MSRLAFTHIEGGWLEYGTVTVDPASLTTGTEGNVDVTIAGVKVGDHVMGMTPPATLEAGLVVKGASVQSANTVRVVLRNASGGTIDGAALVYKYIILHVS